MIFGLGLSGAVLYLTQREYETYGTVLGQSYAGQAQAQAVIAQLASGAAVLGVSLSTAAGLLYLMIRWRKKGDGVPDELVRQSPQPQRAGVLFKTIIVIAVPVCLGSLAVNFSGIIDLMTVTGRLAEVMQTARRPCSTAMERTSPRRRSSTTASTTTSTGRTAARRCGDCQPGPGADGGSGGECAAGGGRELCAGQPPAHPAQRPDGVAHHHHRLHPGGAGHQRFGAGGLRAVLRLQQRGRHRRAALAGAGHRLDLHRPDRRHQQPPAGGGAGEPAGQARF